MIRTQSRQRPIRTRRSAFVLALLALAAPALADSSDIVGPYDPGWARVQPTQVLVHTYDPALSQQQNGALLKDRVRSLVPGQRLEIGPGTYSVESLFNVSLQGTQTQPIWIVARKGFAPVITRSDASQNIMNVGHLSEGPSEYVCFRGLEFTGGSIGVRLYSCSNVWFDSNLIHHTGDAGLAANSEDTEYLHITRNEIHHTFGYGEGMYLGANNGKHVMSHSVIALNHVHHTRGSQGDGIEIKQGSYGNWIAQNLVHDTKYPCLLVYGTDGEAQNLIERNVLFNSQDNVLQVQGEAVVRNNLIMNGAQGFQSADHQGDTKNLTFIHNTVINEKRAGNFQDWSGRPGMVCANNAMYSQTLEAMRFGGATGVTISGNVVVGAVTGTSGATGGWITGNGLADFERASWDATLRNALPVASGALVEAADGFYATDKDLNGATRSIRPAAGAYAYGSYGVHYGTGVRGYLGKAPKVSVTEFPVIGDLDFTVRLTGALNHSDAYLLIGLQKAQMFTQGGTIWNDAIRTERLPTDADGESQFTLPIGTAPTLVGSPLYFQWAVIDSHAPQGLAFSDGLETFVAAP